MIRALSLLALVVAASCTSAATGAPATPRPSLAAASTSPTPVPLDVAAMMGGTLSPATVVAQVEAELVAVRLQDHFVPYRVGVAGPAAALSGLDGPHLYVADGAGGSTRVRALDFATGVEMASVVLAAPIAGHHALAQDRPDRVLALVRAGGGTLSYDPGVRVEAVGTSPFARLSAVSKAACGDRLLASASRIAIVCDQAGIVWIDTLVGQVTPISVTGAPIVAAAILADGAIVVGTSSGTLYRIPAGSTTLLLVQRSSADPIVDDGIAAADGQRFVVLGGAPGRSSVTAYVLGGWGGSGPFAVATRAGGAVALWPDAYFGTRGGIWHVDLQNGLVGERRALGDPTLLTVAAR